jgi:hypothetical protein
MKNYKLLYFLVVLSISQIYCTTLFQKTNSDNQETVLEPIQEPNNQGDNSVIGLLGRWEDVEFPGIVIEFTEDGKFYEYQSGKLVDKGNYYLSGSTVTLEYCLEGDCYYYMNYNSSNNSLSYSSGDVIFRYKKID